MNSVPAFQARPQANADPVRGALWKERIRRISADVVDVRRDAAVDAIDRVVAYHDAKPESDGALALSNLVADGQLLISTEAGQLVLARVWWYVENPEYGESGFLKELAAFERYDRSRDHVQAN